MKAKQKVVSKSNRTRIVRLMVTPDEQYALKKLAWDQTGGNVSEYVRRKLFPNGQTSVMTDDKGA